MERDGGGGTVIKEDSVGIRRIGGVVRGGDGGDRSNVHDCTGQEHL